MKKTLIITALTGALMATPAMAKEGKEMSEEAAWGLGGGAAFGAIVGGPIGAFAGAFVGVLIGEKEAAENTIDEQQVALNQYELTDAELERSLAKNRHLSAQVDALEAQQLKNEQEQIDNLLAMTVQFRSGSANIEPHFASQLDQLALMLKRKPSLNIELSGYADVQGDEQANMKLSARRAQAVERYLVNKGVSKQQVYSQGLGEQRIVQNGNQYETNFFDRRVTVTARSDNAGQMAKN